MRRPSVPSLVPWAVTASPAEGGFRTRVSCDMIHTVLVLVRTLYWHFQLFFFRNNADRVLHGRKVGVVAAGRVDIALAVTQQQTVRVYLAAVSQLP